MRLSHSFFASAALLPVVLALAACGAEHAAEGPSSGGALSDGASGSRVPVAPARDVDCKQSDAHEVCTYAVVDGLSLRVSVHRPNGEGVRPALLWIHGGALVMGHRDWLPEDQLARYLRAGYVVASIDYRLAPESALADIHADVAAAYAWLRTAGAERFAIDPDRIGVVGHSAGGYLTLSAGFRLTPRPKALVSFYGYGDVTGDWYAKPSPEYLQYPRVSRDKALAAVKSAPIANTIDDDGRWDFYVFCRQNGLWPKEVGHHDPSDAAFFAAFEPVRNVTADYPPTMLLHGRQDDDVPFEQATAMKKALEASGVEHELIENASWGHGFDEEENDATVRRVFDRVIAFFDRHVGR